MRILPFVAFAIFSCISLAVAVDSPYSTGPQQTSEAQITHLTPGSASIPNLFSASNANTFKERFKKCGIVKMKKANKSRFLYANAACYNFGEMSSYRVVNGYRCAFYAGKHCDPKADIKVFLGPLDGNIENVKSVNCTVASSAGPDDDVPLLAGLPKRPGHWTWGL